LLSGDELPLGQVIHAADDLRSDGRLMVWKGPLAWALTRNASFLKTFVSCQGLSCQFYLGLLFWTANANNSPHVIPLFWRRKTMRKIALAALLLCAVCGCGTVANLNGQTVVSIGGPYPCPTKPFGGLIQEIDNVRAGPTGGVLCILDMPFTLIGDIVTVPWATYIYATSLSASP
jgi:uncharacterized protein YceK